MHKFLRILGSVVAAIVLGAIGSGLWEKALSPALSATSAATVALISGISSSYQDSIYQRAAKDVSDLYTMKLTFLVLLIAGIALISLVASRTFAGANISAQLRARLHRMLGLNVLTMGLTLVVMSYFALARTDAAAQIKETSLRSLEILRPAIGDQEYIRLRAQFYSMSSKADFDAFRQTTVNHAQRTNVRTPISEGPVTR